VRPLWLLDCVKELDLLRLRVFEFDRTGVINVNTKTLKVMAATAGAGAVIAMGGVAVASNSWAEPETTPAPPGPVTTAEVTTGETITEAPLPESSTSLTAEPEITGPASLPPEEEELPG
jgi:hypothetical protein